MIKKTAFVTFSSNYLKNKINPSYKDFVSVIKNVGFDIIHEWFNKKNNRDAKKIHTEVLKAIRTADYLIAETSIDSIGVGQQITYALQKRKSVIICIKKSRVKKNNLIFLKGTKYGNIEFIYYKNLNDLAEKLKQIFNKAQKPTLEKFNFISTSELKSIISEESRKRQISQSELLRNIIEEWVKNNKS